MKEYSVPEYKELFVLYMKYMMDMEGSNCIGQGWRNMGNWTDKQWDMLMEIDKLARIEEK